MPPPSKCEPYWGAKRGYAGSPPPSPHPQLFLLGLTWSTGRGGPLAFGPPPPMDSTLAPQRGSPLRFGARDTTDLQRGGGDPKYPPPITFPPPTSATTTGQEGTPQPLPSPAMGIGEGGGQQPPPQPPRDVGTRLGGAPSAPPPPPSTCHYPPLAQGFRLPWAKGGGHTGVPLQGGGNALTHPPNCKYSPPPPINHSISLGLGHPPPLANPSRVGGSQPLGPGGTPLFFVSVLPPPPFPPEVPSLRQ